MSLSGGQVTTYQAPFPDATIANYSLGGRKLLLGSMWHTDNGRPILTQRDTGRLDGPFQQVGELTGHEASWSPTGDRSAKADGRFLQVADFDCSGCDADDVRRPFELVSGHKRKPNAKMTTTSWLAASGAASTPKSEVHRARFQVLASTA